jgi:hypothetical protein
VDLAEASCEARDSGSAPADPLSHFRSPLLTSRVSAVACFVALSRVSGRFVYDIQPDPWDLVGAAVGLFLA